MRGDLLQYKYLSIVPVSKFDSRLFLLYHDLLPLLQARVSLGGYSATFSTLMPPVTKAIGFCITRRPKRVKALCNHLSHLKEKHMFSAFMFGSLSLHPESDCICGYALKNKVLRSCVPSCCHADSPSTSEVPAQGLR